MVCRSVWTTSEGMQEGLALYSSATAGQVVLVAKSRMSTAQGAGQGEPSPWPMTHTAPASGLLP